MNDKGQRKTEDTLYLIGLVSLIIMIIIAWIVKKYSVLDRFSIPCVFRTFTGYYCPGCGGTRATRYFLQGKWIKSFIYHPMVPYLGIGGGIFMVRQTLFYISKGRIKSMKFRNIYVYGLAVVLLGQFIIKNVLLKCWNISIIG